MVGEAKAVVGDVGRGLRDLHCAVLERDVAQDRAALVGPIGAKAGVLAAVLKNNPGPALRRILAGEGDRLVGGAVGDQRALHPQLARGSEADHGAWLDRQRLADGNAGLAVDPIDSVGGPDLGVDRGTHIGDAGGRGDGERQIGAEATGCRNVERIAKGCVVASVRSHADREGRGARLGAQGGHRAERGAGLRDAGAAEGGRGVSKGEPVVGQRDRHCGGAAWLGTPAGLPIDRDRSDAQLWRGDGRQCGPRRKPSAAKLSNEARVGRVNVRCGADNLGAHVGGRPVGVRAEEQASQPTREGCAHRGARRIAVAATAVGGVDGLAGGGNINPRAIVRTGDLRVGAGGGGDREHVLVVGGGEEGGAGTAITSPGDDHGLGRCGAHSTPQRRRVTDAAQAQVDHIGALLGRIADGGGNV